MTQRYFIPATTLAAQGFCAAAGGATFTPRPAPPHPREGAELASEPSAVLLRGYKDASELSAVLLRGYKVASETSAVLLQGYKVASETSAYIFFYHLTKILRLWQTEF